MKYLKISIILALSAIALVQLSGCSGLAIWQKGDFYKVIEAEDFSARGIKSIGVYCFSQDGITNSGGSKKMKYSYIPDEVEADGEVEPEAELKPASDALAAECAKYLTEKGYSVKILTDKAHSEDIKVEDLIKSAAGQGMDGVMIIYYIGMNKWVKFGGSYTVGNTTTTTWTDYSGFLYNPGAAIFDCKKGDRIWSFQNYGRYENAHVINLFAKFAPLSEWSLVENGSGSYANAAPIAAKMLMVGTTYWPLTYKPIPNAN